MEIYKKLAEVMKAVEYIKKDTNVSGGGQSYTAVSHDAVVATIRKHMIENGIIVIPNQIEGELAVTRNPNENIKQHLYRGKYEINFINVADANDKHTVIVEAHAADSGDKAPPKCLTQATKMAILKVLMLETGDDEESRTEKSKPVSEGQLNNLKKLYEKLPADRQERFRDVYGIEDLAEMERADYEPALQNLQKALKAS